MTEKEWMQVLRVKGNIFRFRVIVIAVVFGIPTAAMSEAETGDSPVESPSPISLDQIALELSNPVTALRSLDWDIEGTLYQGYLPDADGRSSMRNVLTPSWPFKLKNGNNILLSLTIPLNSDQPLWEHSIYLHHAEWRMRQIEEVAFETGFLARGHDHLDDISLDIGYGGTSDNGVIGMLGLSAVFSTNDDGTAERDQVLLGPEFVLGKVASWGLIGMRVKHLTNVYDTDTRNWSELPWDTNETPAKLFFAYAMGNGWQIESNPTILYDWEAVSGNEWTVPIGAGVSKTMRLGSVPVKFALDIQKFVVSPDRFGPDWQVTLSLTPVLSSKLLK